MLRLIRRSFKFFCNLFLQLYPIHLTVMPLALKIRLQTQVPECCFPITLELSSKSRCLAAWFTIGAVYLCYLMSLLTPWLSNYKSQSWLVDNSSLNACNFIIFSFADLDQIVRHGPAAPHSFYPVKNFPEGIGIIPFGLVLSRASFDLHLGSVRYQLSDWFWPILRPDK